MKLQEILDYVKSVTFEVFINVDKNKFIHILDNSSKKFPYYMIEDGNMIRNSKDISIEAINNNEEFAIYKWDFNHTKNKGKMVIIEIEDDADIDEDEYNGINIGLELSNDEIYIEDIIENFRLYNEEEYLKFVKLFNKYTDSNLLSHANLVKFLRSCIKNLE